ncbi:hypothetical protein D2A34_21950 [Clostridium chromiireducens]|uniref:BppU N-terminal domain-containing protein n=1 Tax=Clostridium chromiireducens TaxID=225345 RepID=A0A399IIY3_9CLOT|nr:BppU family phage baseplate upper protein [Clostridium chromiireducens]RII32861.1 hypothetical protein D2A34_21950 [Clostridium chromiireducens]
MDLSFYSGDSRNLIINVVDENNSSINLTGATVEWALINNDLVLIKKSINSGITISNATGGQFKIEITSSDTDNLSGNYRHLARVTTADGRSSIVISGTIKIEKSLI